MQDSPLVVGDDLPITAELLESFTQEVAKHADSDGDVNTGAAFVAFQKSVVHAIADVLH